MSHSAHVLLVDDDAAVREALAQTLDLDDITATVTGSFVEAKDHITRAFPGVILSDIRMPGRDGFHLLDYVHSIDPELPVVLLTGEGDVPTAVRAIGEGAFDFLEKPCAPQDLLTVLRRAMECRDEVLRLRAERRRALEGDAAARLVFGLSDLAEALRADVRAAGRADAEVLVVSPPGGGVSKIAEAIHLCSPRAKAPFIKVAAQGLDAVGLDAAFERATEGSLYIDTAQHLAAGTQVHLLDRLEQGAPARIIGGTTEDLETAVAQGRFNADLFYRLQVLSLRIPALSERPEDIPELFRRYVDQAAEQSGQPAPPVTPEVLAGLMARDWPGNARALMTEAMRFVLGVDQDAVAVDPADAQLGLAEQMAQVERSLLVAALARHHGHASDTARALKLPRKTFYDKLARYGLKAEDYR